MRETLTLYLIESINIRCQENYKRHSIQCFYVQMDVLFIISADAQRLNGCERKNG